GKVLWSKAAPGGPAKTHLKNTLGSSTPAADADHVYAVFWDGKKVSLHAYDHKGKPAWQYELGEYKQVPGVKNRHGDAHSPVGPGGKVFVNFDTTGAASGVAVNAKTGKRAWEAKRKAFRTCYSTPFVLDGNLIVVSTAGVTAYKPDNGEVVWNYTFKFE